MPEITHVDRAVASRIVAGDEREFRKLFDAYFPRLYRYAMARFDGNREEARDAVQQTFCRAIEKLDSYRGEAALYTWFCQICHNVITDRYRALGLEQKRLLRLEDHPQVQAVLESLAGPELQQPDVELWREDVGRLVQATLDRLPGHYADILEWKYIRGLSVAEIGARLELAPKAAESQLTRARAAFRAAMGTMLTAEDALWPPVRQP
jgi:RNA polymerase sigma-70 factor (ECF subfamily)